MVLGSLWLIGGAYFVDIDTDVLGGDVGTSTLALVIALAASVAVIVVGNLWEDRAVAGIGIAGLLFVSTALVGDLVEDTGPAIVVIVLGVAMVVVGAVLSRRGGGAAVVPPGPVEAPLASDPPVPPAPTDAPGDPQDRSAPSAAPISRAASRTAGANSFAVAGRIRVTGPETETAAMSIPAGPNTGALTEATPRSRSS